MKRYRVDFYKLSGQGERCYSNWKRMYIDAENEEELDNIMKEIIAEEDFDYSYVGGTVHIPESEIA